MDATVDPGLRKAYRRATRDLALLATGFALLCASGVTAFLLTVTRPLADYPTDYTNLDEGRVTAAAAIGDAHEMIREATGAEVNLATAVSLAAQTYATTFLPANDPTISALDNTIAECQALVEVADVYLDDSMTVVGQVADPERTPTVITLNQATSLTDTLTECVTQLDTAAVEQTWETARDDAAYEVATTANTAARASLQTAIDAAASVLASSDGKVTDPAVRDTLSAATATAQTTLTIQTPPDTWELVDLNTTTLTGAIDPITAATRICTENHQHWQTQHNAAAAQQAKKPSGTTSRPSTPSNSGTSSGGTRVGGGVPGSGCAAFGTCTPGGYDQGRPQQLG